MFSLLVKRTTITTNVSIAASLNANATEFGHSGYKSPVESSIVIGPSVDGWSRATIGEEILVGSEGSFAFLQILEVNVVEHCWSVRVHVNGDSWVNVLGTSILKLFSVKFVEGWVNGVCSIEVVDSAEYFATMSKSDGVSRCIVVKLNGLAYAKKNPEQMMYVFIN